VLRLTLKCTKHSRQMQKRECQKVFKQNTKKYGASLLPINFNKELPTMKPFQYHLICISQNSNVLWNLVKKSKARTRMCFSAREAESMTKHSAMKVVNQLFSKAINGSWLESNTKAILLCLRWKFFINTLGALYWITKISKI
jgi:hypothetical protein